MKPHKMALAIGGMSIMGAIAFCVLGALMEFRVGRPLPAPRQLSATGRAEPAAVLQQGIQQALDMANRALRENKRADAAAAMDAAKRAAEVARDSFGGPFVDIFSSVESARLAIQDGNPFRAQRKLSETTITVSQMRPGEMHNRAGEPEQLNSFTEYAGAKVLNTRGTRIGEVERIEGDRAIIVVGGARYVFGFIDLPGGRRI